MISSSFLAPGATRGSVVYTPSTSVKIWHRSAPKAAARATALVSDPPRPRVVTSPTRLIPWKPATRTILFLSSSRWMRSESMRLMRASEYVLLVWSPTCHAHRLMTGRPMPSRAMAHRAMEICSPVLSSISISRLEARGLISLAFSMRSSVVSPWADSTTITWFPALYVSAMMPATFRIRWASRTELPPNFCTIKLIKDLPLSG